MSSSNGCHHIRFTKGAERFEELYREWSSTLARGAAARDVASCCCLEMAGMGGKSSFIRQDVAAVLEKREFKRKGRRPLLIHVDYDSRTVPYSKLDVLLEIRWQLRTRNIATDNLDCCLSAYTEALDGRLLPLLGEGAPLSFVADNEVASSVVSLIDNALGGWIEPVAAIAAASAKAVTSLASGNRIRYRELKDMLADRGPKALMEISHLMLSADLSANADSLIGPPVVVALDSVENGAGFGAWEREFLENPAFFGLAAGRDLGPLRRIGPSIDLKGDAKGVIAGLFKSSDAEVPKELEDWVEASGLVGLAVVCMAVLDQKGDGESELLAYARAQRRAPVAARDERITLSDILDIQLGGLPGDREQALFMLAWFGEVSPRWLASLVPAVRANSRALSASMQLPYMLETKGDGQGTSAAGPRYRMHDMVAHLLRLKCDALTIDSMLFELQENLPASLRRHNADDLELTASIAKLQSARLLQELGDDVDEMSLLALPDVTEPEALARWRELATRCPRKSGEEADGAADGGRATDGVLREFDELLLSLLQWNGLQREGADSKGVLDRAKAIAEAYAELAEDATPRLAATLTQHYVRSLIQSGAIASDEYRATSDLAYHLEGFASERRALSTLLGQRDTTSRVLLADVLNSVAVSTYRLRDYRRAYRFHALAIDVADSCGDGQEKLAARCRRTCLATLVSACKDEGGLEGMGMDAGQACRLADEAAALDAGGAWQAAISKAELLQYCGRVEEAMEELSALCAEMDAKGVRSGAVFSRREQALARCFLEEGSGRDVAAALAHARAAFADRLGQPAGRHGIDAGKSCDLLVAAKEAARAAGIRVDKGPEDEGEALEDAYEELREKADERRRKDAERRLPDGVGSQLDALLAEAEAALGKPAAR